MTTTDSITEFEIGSTCICETYDEDTDTSTPSDYCYGCWQDEAENFKYEILKPWLEANGFDEDTVVHVFSGNMNWNKVAGWTSVRAGEILDCLTLNADFILRFKLSDKTLTCVRSSHDEFGALFEFAKIADNNFAYQCQCECGCEQGYDYQPSTICAECQDSEHQN